MRYLHIIALLLLLSAPLGINAQRVPHWMKRLPKPDNETYVYVHTSGVGSSLLQAREMAVAEMFNRTIQRIGVAVNAADISRALQAGGTVEYLSQQYKIPVQVVCEYHRNVPNGVEVHLLTQVAVAGNINVMFSPYSKCEEHLSDKVAYVDNTLRMEVAVMRNGTSGKYESNDLQVDDYFYVRYHSNRAGFVSVWLEDEDGIVQRLLPFRGNNPVALDANRTYLLFSDETRSLDGGMQYQATISNGRSRETDRLHIVFSPTGFRSLRTDNQGRAMPETASHADFNRWYEQLVRNNPGTIIRTQEITIKKR